MGIQKRLSEAGRPALPPGSTPTGLPVRPVHTRVPGRARFKVAGLYRSQRVRRHLETNLRGIDGIRSVEANVLTGNLLIQYTPEKSVEDIVQLIAAQLRLAPPYDSRIRSRDAGASVHVNSRAAARRKEIPSGFEPPVSVRHTPAHAVRSILRCGPDVVLEPRARSNVSVMLTPSNSLPAALLITPALISVPLGFLRTFSVELFHASPILIFLTLLIILMGQIVGKKEGWSKADALYFSFVTATTVGYGDLHPSEPVSKALAVMIAFVGVIFTGIFTAIGLHSAQSAFAGLRPAGAIS